MRIILTGGGTGGHVTPLKPVIQQLKQIDPSVEIMFVGQKNDPFSQLIQPDGEVDQVELINTGKYRRYPNESLLQRLFDVSTHGRNFIDVFKIAASTIRSIRLIRKFKPDVVFGNGGFVSVPVGWAASFAKVPLVIHESDARPGVATRILSGRSNKVLFGVPTRTTTIKGKAVEFVGIPLRQAFTQPQKHSKEDLKLKLGFDPKLPLVTVSGGSLGAEAINNALIASIPLIVEKAQIAHITGDKNLERLHSQTTDSVDSEKYQAIGFTDSIDSFFAASDIVVTRASATTFSELACLGKATILIPAKQLSDQIENASVLNEKGVAEVIDEHDLETDGSLLGNYIVELLGDGPRLHKLQDAIAKMAKPDAARAVAKWIYMLGGGDVTTKE